MTFNFAIPTPSGPMDFKVDPGTSLLFVGANGGGKTRLAVRIEGEFGLSAHRISAHRALTLNPSVPKISERAALFELRTGYTGENAEIGHREGNRWHSKAAVSILDDYNQLVQSLFAEQANTSLTTHQHARAGLMQAASPTKFEKLVEIWDRILPHRKLDITGDDIKAFVAGTETKYTAADIERRRTVQFSI